MTSIKGKYFLIMESSLNGDSFASCFLTNLDFLVSYIAYFDNRIFLPLLVFEILGFILSVSFLHFKQYDKIVLYLRLYS